MIRNLKFLEVKKLFFQEIGKCHGKCWKMRKFDFKNIIYYLN